MSTKSAARVREGLMQLEKRLFFEIISIKFDSGSEFMNYGVISYLRDGFYKNQIGGRIIKKYDTPKPPLQRLLESTEGDSDRIEALKKHYQALDPIDIQLGLESKLKEFFTLLSQKSMVQAA